MKKNRSKSILTDQQELLKELEYLRTENASCIIGSCRDGSQYILLSSQAVQDAR